MVKPPPPSLHPHTRLTYIWYVLCSSSKRFPHSLQCVRVLGSTLDFFYFLLQFYQSLHDVIVKFSDCYMYIDVCVWGGGGCCYGWEGDE